MRPPREFGLMPRVRYRPELSRCPHCGAPLVVSHPVWRKPIKSRAHRALEQPRVPLRRLGLPVPTHVPARARVVAGRSPGQGTPGLLPRPGQDLGNGPLRVRDGETLIFTARSRNTAAHLDLRGRGDCTYSRALQRGHPGDGEANHDLSRLMTSTDDNFDHGQASRRGVVGCRLDAAGASWRDGGTAR